ncbi:MAG: hypothetical protein PVH37_29465 [Desulfobacterales bacterium]
MGGYLTVEKEQWVKFRIINELFGRSGIKPVIIGAGLQPISVYSSHLVIRFQLVGHFFQSEFGKAIIRIGIDNILPIGEPNASVPGTINRLSFRGSNINYMLKLPHQFFDVLRLILCGTRIHDNNFKLLLLI